MRKERRQAPGGAAKQEADGKTEGGSGDTWPGHEGQVATPCHPETSAQPQVERDT